MVKVDTAKSGISAKHPSLYILSRHFQERKPDPRQHGGSGTLDDPYIVTFLSHDPDNPLEFSTTKKYFLTVLVAITTLSPTFVSTTYTASIQELTGHFHCSIEVATLGVSVFVLAFALGPLLWAPLSELYGRRPIFIVAYAGLTVFTAAGTGSRSIGALIIMRFLAGFFGACPLTNGGGTVADMFILRERGKAMGIFSAAPFLGPALGPIFGGFVSESLGWRWLQGLMAIITGLIWIINILVLPETYAPVLLQRMATKYTRQTENTYISVLDVGCSPVDPASAFRQALLRPWALLFREPIVFLISIFMAVIYGTLYMFFGAFPIVFGENRGWSQGISGLAFLGIAVGMTLGIIYCILDNRRYIRVADRYKGSPPPEARLPPALVGAVALPIGLFTFAWTNGSEIPWIVPIIASAPFAFSMVLVFLAGTNYLCDSYTIYAASVLAAASVIRSVCGATFPMFVKIMYDRLGIHWASSVPGFISIACLPFPFLFYSKGASIRAKCKYSAMAQKVSDDMNRKAIAPCEAIAPGL